MVNSQPLPCEPHCYSRVIYLSYQQLENIQATPKAIDLAFGFAPAGGIAHPSHVRGTCVEPVKPLLCPTYGLIVS